MIKRSFFFNDCSVQIQSYRQKLRISKLAFLESPTPMTRCLKLCDIFEYSILHTWLRCYIWEVGPCSSSPVCTCKGLRISISVCRSRNLMIKNNWISHKKLREMLDQLNRNINLLFVYNTEVISTMKHRLQELCLHLFSSWYQFLSLLLIHPILNIFLPLPSVFQKNCVVFRRRFSQEPICAAVS